MSVLTSALFTDFNISAVDRLPSTIQHVLETLAEKTGFKFTIFAGGINPRQRGIMTYVYVYHLLFFACRLLSWRSYHKGRDRDGFTWNQCVEDFDESYFKLWKLWVNESYCESQSCFTRWTHILITIND